MANARVFQNVLFIYKEGNSYLDSADPFHLKVVDWDLNPSNYLHEFLEFQLRIYCKCLRESPRFHAISRHSRLG